MRAIDLSPLDYEIAPDLAELAAAYGVATSYVGQDHNVHLVTSETVRKVLATLHIDASSNETVTLALAETQRARWQRVLPPVIVTRVGTPATIAVRVRADARVALKVRTEDGLEFGDVSVSQPWIAGYEPSGSALAEALGEVVFALPADLPLGWHHVIADVDGVSTESTLVVTPVSLPIPTRGWGLTAQLYSTRSRESWGVGDLGDLRMLAQWGAKRGADFVAINPIFAPAPTQSREPSPYMPITRRFVDPLYLRVEGLPEYQSATSDLRHAIDVLAIEVRDSDLSATLLDRDESWSAKSQALWDLYSLNLGATALSDNSELADYIATEGSDLRAFAIWCSCAEIYGRDSARWPDDLRRAAVDAVDEFAELHNVRIRFHMWMQWRLAGQIEAAQVAARGAGMSIGIIHDLPVGVDPNGVDVWTDRSLFAQGVSVGAPPDLFNQVGQDWSLPPWRPQALEERAYQPFRAMLHAVLRRGGGVRIDHVLGMFRLWWIPTGSNPHEGTYVQYDHEAMLGIIALEALRAGAVVIGEDMGTVQKTVADDLHERGLLGTSVLWFERKSGVIRPPDRWRADVFACATVHDIPPTAGFIEGEHIRLRTALGLLTEAVDDVNAKHQRLVKGWLSIARGKGLLPKRASLEEQVKALNALVLGSPSVLRGVALTDIVGERRAQNQPGTYREYANWCIPLGDAKGKPVFLEDIFASTATGDFLTAVGAGPRILT